MHRMRLKWTDTSTSGRKRILARTAFLPSLGMGLLAGTLAVSMIFGSAAADEGPGARSLFDGEGLDGWTTFSSSDGSVDHPDAWTVDGGLLTTKGTPLGYIQTSEEFENFKLLVEWRWPPGKQPGKGGILVRISGDDMIWPRSLEAQINHPDAGDFWGLNGYNLDGPADRKQELDHPKFGHLINLRRTADAEKPSGQWNRYEIVARGDTVDLILNGRHVNRATGCDVLRGPVALTAEGDAIQFRRVEIIELK